MKVKVRNKIVADGLNDDTFDFTNKGVHVNAEMFNEIIEDPNTDVHIFQFFQGQDDQGQDQFLIVEVPVVE